MITFLLVVHALIAAALVTVILMQRSEGGGLGMGGGPAGLMTARGAADFLTRATSVLATIFVIMAFVIAAIASRRDSAGKIDASLATQGPVKAITAPAPAGGSPLPGIPMAGQPIAPAPDAATQQALQPAAAGLPAQLPGKPDPKAQAAALHAQADALRKAVPAPEIKKIDTSKTDKALGSLGNVGSLTRKPESTAPAAATPAPAPAATKPAIPTITVPAPAPTTTPSNGATPQ